MLTPSTVRLLTDCAARKERVDASAGVRLRWSDPGDPSHRVNTRWRGRA